MQNICAECHRLGKGCCYFKESNNNFQMGLFPNDIEKICVELNVEPDYFIVKDIVEPDIIKMFSNFNYAFFDVVFKDNVRYKLKIINEKCIFLNDNGCSLPLNARPLFCRAYPFWLSKNYKNIYVFSSTDCLAQEKSTLNWMLVNEYFNYSETYLRNMFEELKIYFDQKN